jgi:hypothetical protein
MRRALPCAALALVLAATAAAGRGVPQWNHGRGFVLIGHSEGAFVLEQLIQQQIEPSAAERKLFISAILLGGDVTVADGSGTGGTFKRTPACTSAAQTGCVVAYSSWGHTPPAKALFQDATAGHHVLCVNPAAPGSTAAVPIDSVYAGINAQGGGSTRRT